MRYSTSMARFLATSSERLAMPMDSETSLTVSPFQRAIAGGYWGGCLEGEGEGKGGWGEGEKRREEIYIKREGRKGVDVSFRVLSLSLPTLAAGSPGTGEWGAAISRRRDVG